MMMMMMIKSFSVTIAFILLSNPLLVAAQGAVVYQSTAVMNLNIEKSTSYTVAEIYNVELETIRYLAEPLLQATAPNNVDILNTHVSVTNQLLLQDDGASSLSSSAAPSSYSTIIIHTSNGDGNGSSSSSSSGRIILNMVVAVIYIAPKNEQQQQQDIELSAILANVVDPHQLAMALNVPSLSASYGPKDATVMLNNDYNDDDSSSSTKSAADKGLIATTVFLAIGLATLALVVLYVSGASCSGCKSWVINCLFEEVVTGGAEGEEGDFGDLDKSNNNTNNNKDHRGVVAPSNFQVHTYDEESVSMSSVSLAMQTNPSGILGANHVDDNHTSHHHNHQHSSNPAAGLGIKTPVRHSSGGANGGEYDSELLETPMSQQQPLGITSIRKMPLQQQQQHNNHQQQHHPYYHHHQKQQQLQPPSDASSVQGGGDDANGGGLVNMIMQRLNLNENNK